MAKIFLPDRYLITPQGVCSTFLLQRLQQLLEKGLRLVCFRDYQLNDEQYLKTAKVLSRIVRRYRARLLLHNHQHLIKASHADGIHCSSRNFSPSLSKMGGKSHLGQVFLSCLSCHTPSQLRKAQICGFTFAVLGPVQYSASHLKQRPLGWREFRRQARTTPNLPIYAIGGLSPSHILPSKKNRGQGIAAISSIWNK